MCRVFFEDDSWNRPSLKIFNILESAELDKEVEPKKTDRQDDTGEQTEDEREYQVREEMWKNGGEGERERETGEKERERVKYCESTWGMYLMSVIMPTM